MKKMIALLAVGLLVYTFSFGQQTAAAKGQHVTTQNDPGKKYEKHKHKHKHKHMRHRKRHKG